MIIRHFITILIMISLSNPSISQESIHDISINDIDGNSINIGSFKGKKILLEVNLFGFNGNLYKKILNVYFCNFIRGDKKFKNKISLINQMKKDLTRIKFDFRKKIIL